MKYIKIMTIIVVGAGITGATFALAIAKFSKNTLKVILIDNSCPSKYNKYKKNNDRILALSAGTCESFSTIDIWKHLRKYSNPIKKIYINDYNHIDSILINAKNYTMSFLGQIVSLKKCQEIFFQLLKKRKIINLIYPYTVKKISFTKNNVIIKLNNQKVFFGKLLVLADGTNSKLVNLCGINYIQNHKNRQIVLTANIFTQFSNHFCAFEYFTKLGSLAILPIKKKLSAIIWCFPIYKKEEIKKFKKHELLKKLQDIFGLKLGKFLNINNIKIIPIVSSIAQKITNHRLVIIGNAAQTLHPIAAQGLNLGIRDAIILAETIVLFFNNKKDLGNSILLNFYKKRRQLDRKIAIYITNFLNLFSKNFFPFLIIRNFGIIFFKKLSFIRHKFINYMMGLNKY